MPHTLISPEPLRVTVDAYWVVFQPNVARQVPEFLFQACIDAGAKPFDGTAVETPKPTIKADRTQELVDVMLDILAEGDPKLLTSNLEPRFDEVQKRVDFKFSKTERDNAWSIASGINGDSE